MLGFLLISCSNGLTTWAIKFIPSYLGALISSLMPFVMIVANFIFFKEKILPKTLLGLIIGFTGVTFLLSSFIEEMNDQHFAFGVLLTLIGVLTWTTGTLMTVRNKRKLDPFVGIGWQMFFGGLILYLASWITGQQVSLSTVPMATWGWIAYLTSIGSIACFLCYLYALKHLPISLVSIYVYLNPLVALLLGILFLNEKLTWSIVMGAMLIFVGIYIVMKSRSVKKRLN
ncbi:MAG: EamA family transporter [Bacteroidetes bacterium]|nr:EamA family transporter [Bacteroidota bacterium]MBK7588418.1 EamA family transporter [Bacteroidota bacterium]